MRDGLILTGESLLRLDGARWCALLMALARKARATDAEHQADVIREARRLLARAPVAWLVEVPEMAIVEALLAVRAYDSAALALLPEAAAFMVSRSEDGAHLASVILPGMAEEITMPGASLALALIAALVGAQADVGTGEGACDRDATMALGTQFAAPYRLN